MCVGNARFGFGSGTITNLFTNAYSHSFENYFITFGMRLTFSIFGRLLTTFVLVFALMAVGFAHRVAPANMTPELAAYVAMGGSLADLCGRTEDPDQTGTVSCEACRIADASIVPREAGNGPVLVLERTRTFSFVAKRLHHNRPLDPARLTRAPPFQA